MKQVRDKCVRWISEVLRSNRLLREWVYLPTKGYARQRLLTLSMCIQNAECDRLRECMSQQYPEEIADTSFCVGIFKDPLFCYEHYIAACLKANVPYKLVDIFASDWIVQVKASGCDVFFVWPGECIAEWKKLFDERLLFLTRDLGKKLYPSYESLWLYGSKERQHDWLKIHGFPHPETWVFYRLEEALAFVRQADYPLIAKTDLGAASYGVRVLKTRHQAIRLVRQVFSRGIVGHCADRSAWQWQHILFQEFLPDIEEWRMVRIGDSFFGHKKSRGVGGFHSGSGECEYAEPPEELLDLLKAVTDAGEFRSMSLDVFRTPDGRLLINECQAVFGCAAAKTQTIIHGVPGRYVWNRAGWRFEAGDFCGNFMCDLRLEDVLTLSER